MTSATATIPGYIAGTWTIDPVHSEIGFVVRHMMVSKVRGRFTGVEGTITTAADPSQSTATAVIALDTISTGNEQRDGHLRSADFFATDENPTMTWHSTGLRVVDGEWVADGELTLNKVTKSVPLALEINGIGPDAYGGTRIGFTGTGEIQRSDFGITYNGAIEGGGVVVSDKVTLALEVQGVLDK